MAKHTPGRWQQHDADYCPLEIWGDLDGPLEDGKVRGTLVCTVENERDVPIIIAAPDLLEACKSALRYIETDLDSGEHKPGDCWCTDTGAGTVVDGVLVGDLLQCEACKLRAAISKAESPCVS